MPGELKTNALLLKTKGMIDLDASKVSEIY